MNQRESSFLLNDNLVVDEGSSRLLFFGFLRLAEPSTLQIALKTLDVRNGFQNHVQFTDVFLAFNGWNEFLQSSVRIDFGTFSSHVSVLFHHSPGCFLVVGGWQHWCHLHTHDYCKIFVRDLTLFRQKVLLWSDLLRISQ